MAMRTCPFCGAPDYGTPFCVSCQKPFPRPGPDEASADAGGERGPARAAGFFRRFWALVIDWLVLGVVADALHLAYRAGLGREVGIAGMDAVFGLTTVVALLYFTILVGDGGQTLGKRILGVRVRGINGSPVTYGRALARALGYLLSAFFGTFLGFLWALWDRRNQTWHDKIAGTVVVRV